MISITLPQKKNQDFSFAFCQADVYQKKSYCKRRLEGVLFHKTKIGKRERSMYNNELINSIIRHLLCNDITTTRHSAHSVACKSIKIITIVLLLLFSNSNCIKM